ncbi:uncharacterized protein ARMOST_00305 [Armillaria ostoyae]|uniref:Uncharacterized protein n=1 Tax=Armillaria ostoyae TaxID=47428 RepID=A0A284QKV3_ARMOS|nr:uncharacterized protein ARMOST_00305 [Armillaria ostoyae]
MTTPLPSSNLSSIAHDIHEVCSQCVPHLLPNPRPYSDGLLYWQHQLQYLSVLEFLEELLAAVRERLDTIDIGVHTDVHKPH